jgi:hypothetical protein
MNKEFIPYEQALALKELGFDEPCFGYYVGKDKEVYTSNETLSAPFKFRLESKTTFVAPLYQQAFRWFREKYNLFGYSYPNDYQMYGYRIVELKSFENKELIYDWGTLNTHEEAELECLKKLIEICKNN